MLQANIAELLPFVTFGAISLIAAILVLFLPETLHQDLPDTIEEAKNIGRKDRIAK